MLKRSFVVVIVVVARVGGESCAKNVPNRKKCAREQNKFKKRLASVVHYGIDWPIPYMASYGLTWSDMAFLWYFMVKRFYWNCIVFPRGHRSKFI